MDRTIAVAEVAQDRLADRRRAGRTADKADRATAEQVLDPATRLLLFDMPLRWRRRGRRLPSTALPTALPPVAAAAAGLGPAGTT